MYKDGLHLSLLLAKWLYTMSANLFNPFTSLPSFDILVSRSFLFLKFFETYSATKVSAEIKFRSGLLSSLLLDILSPAMSVTGFNVTSSALRILFIIVSISSLFFTGVHYTNAEK